MTAALQPNHFPFASAHVGASDYNPSTGRFLSEDPIGFGGSDFNLYRYVLNSPILKTDPSGQFIPAVLPIIIAIDFFVKSIVASGVTYFLYKQLADLFKILDELEKKGNSIPDPDLYPGSKYGVRSFLKQSCS